MGICVGPLSYSGNTLPSGAIGLWYIDQYNATNHAAIPNSAASVAISPNLYGASRKLFNNTDWWDVGGSTTVTDDAATAPDGTMSASTVVSSGNWYIRQAGTLPAGTYTMAINAKRNTGTDQQFAFYDGVGASTKTATSAWQRFTYTFTTASNRNMLNLQIKSFDDSTGVNIQICDFELYSGSSDLGPQVFGGNLYLGLNAFDTKPTYSGGALDVSTGGYGLIQFPTDQTITTFTIQALISNVAVGSGNSPILSKVENYTHLAAFADRNTVPSGFFNGTELISTGAGLWSSAGKGYHVITFRYDGTTLTYWLDDILFFQQTASLSSVTVSDLYLNIFAAISLYGGSKFAGVIALWNRSLTNSEVLQAVIYQQNRASISGISATNANRVLVAEGDSITGGFAYSYPYLFGPNASPALYGTNNAVSGSGVPDLVVRAAALNQLIPTNLTGKKFILSVLIGANDLGVVSVTTFLNELAPYLDARRATGWIVVLCTILPRTALGFNANRNIANTELRLWTTSGIANPGKHADYICDFAADPTMGPDAAAADTTYYADGLHPTATGQAILETIYRPVINGI